jgi:hypothetical protein
MFVIIDVLQAAIAAISAYKVVFSDPVIIKCPCYLFHLCVLWCVYDMFEEITRVCSKVNALILFTN